MCQCINSGSESLAGFIANLSVCPRIKYNFARILDHQKGRRFFICLKSSKITGNIW